MSREVHAPFCERVGVRIPCATLRMMVFFNDPVIVPDAPERAVKMALAMQERLSKIALRWSERGHELSLGIGIAQGYATLGAIGFEQRIDYGAIGNVTNLAFRLCGEAGPGQILMDQNTLSGIGPLVQARPVGDLALKGLRPVTAFAIIGLKN